jgi:hypothetical protein
MTAIRCRRATTCRCWRRARSTGFCRSPGRLIGCKTVAEAIHLRTHVPTCLGEAAAAVSPRRRQAALAFVLVGGFAGVEALGELQDMAWNACSRYPEVQPIRMKWVLVEATERILPEGPRSASTWRTTPRICRGAGASTSGWGHGWCPPKAAAGARLRGFPAWLAHRSCHLSKLPSANRRLRVLADWTLVLMFPREIVSMEAIEHSRVEFTLAASAATKRTP